MGKLAGSDPRAEVCNDVHYLEDGDVAEISADEYQITDSVGALVERVPTRLVAEATEAGLGEHEHFMLKEIFEQPARIRDTFTHGALRDNDFGESAPGIFPEVAAVQILACGTSYHAAWS